MDFGYSRVSTDGTDLELQHAFLVAQGVAENRIFFDHGFAGKVSEQAGLRGILAAVTEGDKVIVPRLERFARNEKETLRLVTKLTDRGVVFQFDRSVYDPRDPFNNLMVTFLAAFAGAEAGWARLRAQEAMAETQHDRPTARDTH